MVAVPEGVGDLSNHMSSILGPKEEISAARSVPMTPIIAITTPESSFWFFFSGPGSRFACFLAGMVYPSYDN
jgi:hypothetical protein